MPRSLSLCLLCIAVLLPTSVLAQSEPEATPTKWVSGQSTDPSGTRTCSVYPVRQGAFPMIFFYGSERDAQLSLEGSDGTPMNLMLQVDANPELDGGFPAMSAKNTAALIGQIRANGGNLRLSQSMLAEGKLQKMYLDLPLAGAAEQLDRCRAWLAKKK